MKTKLDQSTRGFYHLSRAWYGKANLRVTADMIDEVMFGLYPEGGGTTGEMAMRWTHVGGKSTPRLEVFSDAWAALAEFQDVITELAKFDSKDPSPEMFCGMLVNLGFKDRTPTRDLAGRETDELKASAMSKLTAQERAALGL